MLVNGLTSGTPKISSNQITPENCQNPLKVNLEARVDETAELKELSNCIDAAEMQMTGMYIIYKSFLNIKLNSFCIK